jgi:thiol:disulfide interchange protein DsbD
MLASLPKSGGWMLTVKVFLGFLELGLAFKFLSNADLVAHWGLLKREVFLGIWLLLSIGLAAYLLGIFDRPKKPIHWSRYPWIAASIVFGSFMLLGILQKAPLNWLSGFPPPSFYSVYPQESDCPLGLDCYKDFETGLQIASSQNKPILLDFTGWACVNCRRMEENVWSDPTVFNLIKNEFVLISLYVDDRAPLPAADQFIFEYTSGRQKSIKTIGQKWGTFQTVNFNAASQPYYLMMSPDLEILAPAIQYTDVNTYEQWLSLGIQTFKAQ